MTHQICNSCETVAHCSQHGCIPLQPLKPCRSPYCECTPGTCSHPGCYDARGEAWEAEQKALAQQAIKCATETLSDPDHPATIAARNYYGVTAPAKPTLRVYGWVWKHERCDGLYVPSYTPAQHVQRGELWALVDPKDLDQPLENTDWFAQ
jgi:hypothetical protein